MKGDKLTMRQDKFTTLTAENNNPTESARQVYLKGKNKTKKQADAYASTVANQNMAKPIIQKSIAEKIEARLGKKGIDHYHKRNITQDNSVPASNQAIDMYYKLKGDYQPEAKINVNLNLGNIDGRLKELKAEYDKL